MIENKSWFNELVERRIPQILGVYIASVWLAVEVSEWMIERFNVPDQTSSYVGVIMISFLPLVALLAWGHGRPGKDKWTQKQIIFIPFNMLLTYFAVTTFIEPQLIKVEQTPLPPQPINATQTLSLTDEKTGELVKYEVAKAGLSQKVAGFFWENATGDESLDWMRYGAMWLLAKDLARYPIISIRTPYESNTLYSGLKSKGFEQAVGEPLALSFNLARDLKAQWFIKGKILKDDDQVGYEVSLYQVSTGELVATFASTYADWLVALDELSEKIFANIAQESNLVVAENIIPQMSLSQYMSNNLMAVEAVIDSLNSVVLDNDFEQGVKYLNSALEMDDQLAEAYVLLIDYYRGLGNFPAAKGAAEQALKLEYNLNKDTLFKVKANYYAVSGDSLKAVKTLENWVKLSPENTDALSILGYNYMMIGNRLDDALGVYEKLNRLQESGDTALINLNKIYRLKDDREKAIEVLMRYLSLNPGKAEPLLELAEMYFQFGDLKLARKYYDEASVLSFDDISAEIGLIKISAKEGRIDEAILAFDGLLKKKLTDEDQVTVMTEKENLLYLSGQLVEAMKVLKKVRKVSESFLPPMAQNMMFGGKEVAYLASLGRFDAAWKSFNQMKEVTQPPFNEMLEMIAMSIHDLAGEFEKSEQSLARFETFTNQFQIELYDQFVFDAKARYKRNLGEYEAALELHVKAINQSKQSIVTLESMYVLDNFMYEKAVTMLKAQMYDESMELVAAVIDRNPIFVQALVLKLKILIATGQTESASEVVQAINKVWQNADDNFHEYKEFKKIADKLKMN